ncbi:MAG: UDP-3-O-(3-hydroxymyristoyl)glucosamine N-acyltransferase [Betaproteobacteria bacterium]|nr:UDP-3-O-(3-hydroxymyristoyl)glucosamine N-acyltransferase [Betaproteobacteria bacterium]
MAGGDEGVSLGEIVAHLGGRLVGDATLRIRQVATLEQAAEDRIAFFANAKYRKQLKSTRAGAVILAPTAAQDCARPHIVCDNPYAYFARVVRLLNPATTASAGIHPSAVVLSELPATVHVGALAFVDEDVLIGADASIGAGCMLGRGVRIGDDSLLYPRVTVYAGCIIGRNAILHSGAVVGADGFGMAREADGSWTKIPQIGRVVIGDDVEIGANTTIDRGALGDTVIENGVKIDNQVQIAHNVHVGAHTAMAGCVGVAGSTRIGKRCTFGGGAVVLGHLNIADDVNVSAFTLVSKSITQPGTYTGAMPIEPHRAWMKNAARLRHLEAMADRIRELEARLAQLEGGN